MNTRGNRLRDQLAQLETLVGQLGYALGEGALNIPVLFDEVTARLVELQAEGQDVRGEATQLETVSAVLRRKASVFLREIGGAGKLQKVRNVRQPDPAHWWWFLDQLVVVGHNHRTIRGSRWQAHDAGGRHASAGEVGALARSGP